MNLSDSLIILSHLPSLINLFTFLTLPVEVLDNKAVRVMLSGKENMIKTVKDAKNTDWKK
mgnify:CR=1 FL=1